MPVAVDPAGLDGMASVVITNASVQTLCKSTVTFDKPSPAINVAQNLIIVDILSSLVHPLLTQVQVVLHTSSTTDPNAHTLSVHEKHTRPTDYAHRSGNL